MGFANDGDEVLSHPFFAGLDMDKLYLKALEPPFKPEITADQFNLKYFNAQTDAKALAETIVPEAKAKKVEKLKDQFKDFDMRH